jgi:Ni/Co efflux regulator RcnB
MFRFSGLAAVVLMMASTTTMADTQEDAIAATCPNAAAWKLRMQSAHPDRTAEAREHRDEGRTFTAPAYRDELHRRFLADQAARDAWTAKGLTPEASVPMRKVDADNQAWFKPIFTRQGFPTVAEVGERGVDEAFYLVQHNPEDSAFQKAMLPALTDLAKQNLVPKADLAMLTDRILRYEGKPQIYGTQYLSTMANPDLHLEPTNDMPNLDQRRASMDLMPSADWTCVMKVVYAPAKPTP